MSARSGNDKASCYVKATRASSTQSVTSGATTLIFNSELDDVRSAYNNATGVFTAPWDGEYELTTWLDFGGTGLSTSYVAINKNGSTTIAYVPVLLSATQLIGGGTEARGALRQPRCRAS